jgi:hypothetical protein
MELRDIGLRPDLYDGRILPKYNLPLIRAEAYADMFL